MAVELATAYISLVPSAKDIASSLSAELNRPVTQAAKETSDNVSGIFGRMQSKLGDGLKDLGLAVAGAFAAKKVIDFFHSSIDAASDLNESLSKSRVVFGDSSKSVESFAKTAASSLGQSRQEAIEASATFGNLFVALGLGRKPAADMSTSIVKLASDLASFNNVRPEDALEALRAGLVGETEPLRRFGVNINAASLAQEALKLGLVSTTKDALDPAVKAQAAYALILDQTKTAQGDFERTSGGLANQQRILSARVKDLEANLGQALLPVMKIVVSASSDLAAFFSRNTELVGALAAVVGGALTVALGRYVVLQALVLKEKMAEFFETAAIKALYMRDALAAASLSSASMLGAIGLLAAGAAAVAVVLLKAGDGARKAGQALGQQYIDATKGSASATAQLSDRVAELSTQNFRLLQHYQALSGQLGSSAEGLAANDEQYQKNKATIKTLVKELENLQAQQQAVSDANRDSVVQAGRSTGGLVALAQQSRITTDVAQALAEKLKIDVTSGTASANEQFRIAAQRLTVANPAALALQDALARLAEKTADATDRSKAFKDALDLLIGGNIDAEKAVVNLFGRLDELGQKLVDNAKNLDFRTAKGREDITVIEDTVGAIRAHIQSMQAAGATADDMRRALDGDTKAFDDQLRKAGFTTAQIGLLNQQYGLIPDSLNTVITADTSSAQLSLQQLYDKAAQLASKIPFAQQDFPTLKKGQPRASGGPVSPGFVYPVGERGREWFVPSVAGTIIPNSEPAMAAGGGGERWAVIQIGDEVLIKAIKGYESRNGTGWRR